MATRNLSDRAAELLGGKIGFSAYAAAVRVEYERMAAMLLRRWAPPSWVDRDDVVQDMFYATWDKIWSYDPGGADLGAYVVWSAVSGAKRRLHKARGAILHGSPDRNLSRFEVPLSAISRDGAADGDRAETLDEVMGRVMRLAETEEAAADLVDEGARVRVILAHCRTPLESRVVSSVAYHRDPEVAAAELVADAMIVGVTGIRPEEPEVMAAYAAGVAREVEERAFHA